MRQEADYSVVRTDADAILDVSFGQAAYFSGAEDLPWQDSPYLPWLWVGARLITARAKTTLFVQQYAYGNALKPGERVEHIPSAPRFSYDSSGDLLAHAREAVEGLYVRADLAADRIAAALR